MNPSHRFSKKMAGVIERPRGVGIFTEEGAKARSMRCVVGSVGSLKEGKMLRLYWLVDESDGVIVDAKFQVFGPAALIAASDAICELLVSKNYDQARRIEADLIDKQLRDKPDKPAFLEETLVHLNHVLEAVDDAIEKCVDIPLSTDYVSPVPTQVEGEGYPGWLLLSYEKKLAVIEKVLDEEIRPYIELDEGGIRVLKLVDDKELLISYEGSCTTCFSAVGATLATIGQIIQAKVHPDLVVVPNMDDLKF